MLRTAHMHDTNLVNATLTKISRRVPALAGIAFGWQAIVSTKGRARSGSEYAHLRGRFRAMRERDLDATATAETDLP